MKTKAYVGQFIDGQLYSSGEKITIPDGQQVAVTFLGSILGNPRESFPADSQIDSPQSNRSDIQIAAQNFLDAVQTLRDEGFSPEDEECIRKLQSGMYKPHFEERL